MPDHLGDDMRKTKTEDKEEKPIQGMNSNHDFSYSAIKLHG